MIAKTRPLAQRAAQFIKIDYKDLPAIITIEVTSYRLKSIKFYTQISVSTVQDAIAAESYYKPIRSLNTGNTEETFATLPDDQVLSGEIRVGGQVRLIITTMIHI